MRKVGIGAILTPLLSWIVLEPRLPQSGLHRSPVPVGRAWAGGCSQAHRLWQRPKVTAVVDVEIRLSARWRALPRRSDALRIAEKFKELSSREYVDFYFAAAVYTGLGDKDRTFQALENAVEKHSATIIYLKVDAYWDDLRSDPRYAALLRRLGLPP